MRNLYEVVPPWGADSQDSASWCIWQLLGPPESRSWRFPVSWRHSIGHLIWRDTIRFCFPSPWLIIHYHPLSSLEKSVENHSWYILLFRRQVQGQLILLTGCLLEHVASAGLGMVVGSSCGRICCDNIGTVYVTEISVAQSTYIVLHYIAWHCVAYTFHYIYTHIGLDSVTLHACIPVYLIIYAFIQIAFAEFFNRICLATFWNFNSGEHGCSSLI